MKGLTDRAMAYTLLTLDYAPERGGVARYLSELVRASDGLISTVIVERDHDRTGPGQVLTRELFWHAWPKWFPMVHVCWEFRRSKKIIVSHLLPFGTAAMIAKWIGGAPYAVVCHGLDVRLAASRPLKKMVAGLVLRNASLVIANSTSTSAAIKTITPELDAIVITPGVTEPKAITREDARARLGIARDEEIILSAGRLIKRKGFDLLLEATEQLKDRENVRTVIVGDGPELVDLKQLADHLKHPVRFITDASDADLANWYAAVDIFCLPARETEHDVEGFGIVYLEAASYGLPVIAAQSGGAVEAVVDGETGILIPQNNVKALTGALQSLLEDPDLRHRRGKAGKDRVHRAFQWKDRWGLLKESLDRS